MAGGPRAISGIRRGVLLVLLGATACASHGSYSDGLDPSLVHAAVLNLIRDGTRQTSRMVLAPTSRAISSEAPLLSYIPEDDGLAAAFAAANRTDATFSARDAERLGMSLFDSARIPPSLDPSKPNPQWQDLVRSYGGDGLLVVRLSRPGFSVDGRTAAVYYGWTCGGLCGQTHLALLEWEDGRWRIVSDRIILVS